jgi:two-component system chemotaxis response regulator CheY
MRRIHQKGLEKLGLSVVTAVDGVDALRVLGEKDAVGLVLTDIHMPNMDGISLTREIRKMPKYQATKILVVTSDGTLDVVSQAVESGANDVLIKPFTPDDFLERVRLIIDA